MKKPGKMIREVLTSILRKPATVLYPFVQVRMPANFRGKLRFHQAKCIACKLCVKDCPSDAITITKHADGKIDAEIDLSRCIFCAQCVDSCPKDALEATAEFEIANGNRAKLKVELNDRPDHNSQSESQGNP